MELTEQIIRPYWMVMISLLVALLTANPVWLVVPVIVAFSTIIRYRQSDNELPIISVHRSINGKRYKENDIIKVTIKIVNHSNIVFRGELFDLLPSETFIMEGNNIFLLHINPGEELYLKYSISFSVRGQYFIGNAKTRYHTDGELHHEVIEHKELTEVLIIPIPEQITRYNIPPQFLRNIGGSFRSKMVGDGVNFTGIREYQIGDSFRRINWKQTAKQGTLFSNEFEINRASNFILVLDLTEEDNDIADNSVRVALGLATYLMNYRCKIGMITIAEYVHVIPIKAGKRHIIEMTEHLTKIKSISKIQNLDLIKNRIKEGVKKISGDKNEIILFSSLNALEKTIMITDFLNHKGDITILSPTGVAERTKDNSIFRLANNMIDIRNTVVSNYLSMNNIKIHHWVPNLPFDDSSKEWRYRN